MSTQPARICSLVTVHIWGKIHLSRDGLPVFIQPARNDSLVTVHMVGEIQLSRDGLPVSTQPKRIINLVTVHMVGEIALMYVAPIRIIHTLQITTNT